MNPRVSPPVALADFCRIPAGFRRPRTFFFMIIFPFHPSWTEVSALLGRAIGRVSTQLGDRNGWPSRTDYLDQTGSITSVQAVYVPADDLTIRHSHNRPPRRYRCPLATLSRTGHLSAVGPLNQPVILDPRVVGDDHYAVARSVKSIATL